MIIAANTSLQLAKLGYEVTGIVPRGEEVLPQIHQHDFLVSGYRVFQLLLQYQVANNPGNNIGGNQAPEDPLNAI